MTLMILRIAVAVAAAGCLGYLCWRLFDQLKRIGIDLDRVWDMDVSAAQRLADLERRLSEHESDAEQVERERRKLAEDTRIVDGLANIFAYDVSVAMGKNKDGAE